jgi:hypothetical protein
LELNIFYGVTAVASLCLAVAGIILHWQLMFIEQYLFLQAPLVWATNRLLTVIHEILPTKDHDLDDIETPGSNMMSSCAMDVIGESTDEKQENNIPQ